VTAFPDRSTRVWIEKSSAPTGPTNEISRLRTLRAGGTWLLMAFKASAPTSPPYPARPCIQSGVGCRRLVSVALSTRSSSAAKEVSGISMTFHLRLKVIGM